MNPQNGRPRDSQRSKLYEAERATFSWHNPDEQMTMEEVRAFLDKLMTSAWWKRRWPMIKPNSVTLNRGRGGAWASTFQITLGVKARRKWIVLHELSHVIVLRTQPRAEAAWHGWQFAKIYLELVNHVLGKDAHDRLRESFRSRRVRYKQPRTRSLTPEQRAAAGARLAAARASREVRDGRGQDGQAGSHADAAAHPLGAASPSTEGPA